jgi:gamma-glutamylputrescine oxidase
VSGKTMSIAYLQESKLPASYYEASTAAQRVAYPTLQGDVSCDVCVVGGGLAGLHTALNLAEHGHKVVLLEARRIGWGASGRNGGHLIPEFACGMSTLEDALGFDDARRCWTLAREAAEAVRSRIVRHRIECDYQPGHIEVGIGSRHVAHLRRWRARAELDYDYEYRFIERDEMRGFVGSDRYQGGLLDTSGGHLHPLKLTLGLAQAFVAAGGAIFENSAVTTWTDGARPRIRCAGGEVDAGRLVLASNVGMESMSGATARKLAARILPVGTWMIATPQLPDALADELLPTRAAVADNRVVLDYFRLSADKRMIFGGGCSYLGEGTPAGFAESMLRAMVEVFPQLRGVPAEFAWGGVIDISMSRAPDFGRVVGGAGNVYFAQGFSGSGLVATCVAGRVLAEAIAGDERNLNLFMRLKHLPFPGGRLLRGPVTAAGMLYHRLRDLI